MSVTESSLSVFTSRKPSKISFGRRLRMGAVGWGPITSFYLESVKVIATKGGIRSTAIIKVGDKCGKVIVMFEGSAVATLFGLTPQKWAAIEKTAVSVGELFYRRFKNGINDSFSPQQKLFYHFCLLKQTRKVLFITFQRVKNYRKFDKTKAFLKVLESYASSPMILRIYFQQIEQSKQSKQA